MTRAFLSTMAALLATPLGAAESDALAIAANLQARHMPFGTIADPIFASATSDQIVGYSRCGDSALWTGAYLAAESFHYSVTRSADALRNVQSALAGLKALTDVTGDNRLARCMVPANSPFAQGIASEEAQHAIHSSPPWIWVDNTSRDQIVGAFFGLGVAFDLVDDPAVRSGVSDLTTRLMGFVSRHRWSPNDDISNTFELRPEELQMLLQLARHVNPGNTVSGPFFVLPVRTAVSVDVQSLGSYYKFNLAYMTFYHLVKLQNNSDNLAAYQVVRNYTAAHQNAFFNLIDRALRGADAARDAETVALLDQWLQRPRRDPTVDLRNSVSVCFDRACAPIPVPLRVPTDFLWQRDPFQLAGGGTSVIEGAGVDYLLPYWMARYYGVLRGFGVQPAAAPGSTVAPDSLASLFGANLAAVTATASQPLPGSLAGVTHVVTDSLGVRRIAPMQYVSPGQINFVVPDGTPAGTATFTVTSSTGSQSFTAQVAAVAPVLFSMNGTGSGVAAATAILTQAPNPQIQSLLPVFQCTAAGCIAVPINLGIDTPIYVTFYGTGLRNRSSLANVAAKINGISVPVLYAGASPAYDGLDQVNVALLLSLRGAGETSVVLTADGQNSNAVTINVQ